MDSSDFIFEKCGQAKVVFTSRNGGVSQSPYDSLNVGTHVGDDIDSVLKNREIISQSIAQYDLANVHEWIFLNQTHCDEIFEADTNTYNCDLPPTADAAITQKQNLPLIAMIADCGPLVLSCGQQVAVVHASAKTVSLGLIEKTIVKLKLSDSKSPIHALLGPCIHPENYEYSQDLLNEMSLALGAHVVNETNAGKPAFNLPLAIEFICKKAKIEFRDLNIDTYSNKNYFSYRRDGITGRQCAIAWI